MDFLEITKQNETICVNIERILMFKRISQDGSYKCCIVMGDNSLIWCDEKYFSVLIALID